MRSNEKIWLYLPSQISETDIQLVLFTSLFRDAIIWNWQHASMSTHKYQSTKSRSKLIRVYYNEIWKVEAPVAASTALSASWTVLWGLERLDWRPLCPWAERTLRKRTSLALKKATMKGCLSWGPLPVTSPASWGFLLWPAEGDRVNKMNCKSQPLKMTTHLSLYWTIICLS